MEIIKKDGINKIVKFKKRYVEDNDERNIDDFMTNGEDINRIMLAILSSYETADDRFDAKKSKAYVKELNDEIEAKDYVDVNLYVLFDEKKGTPVSFALFSLDHTREDWHLEFISTNKDYRGMGYAEKIFLNAAKDISNSEFPYISSVVNEDNYASMQLHEAFSRKKGVKTFSEEMDSEDELYDAYEDDKEEEYYNSYEDNNEDEKTDLFGNSSEDSGRYSNRVSFLFDVKGLQQVDIDKLEEEENEEF